MSGPKEIKRPREGMSTLSAQFTKRFMDRVVAAIKQMRDRGKTEVQIFEKLKADLKHVDEHTLRRFYDRSLGRTLPDDFAADAVASRHELKPGTVELQLTAPPAHLHSGSVVQFEGLDWCLTRLHGKTLTLKLIR